jgi:hypothetical protein
MRAAMTLTQEQKQAIDQGQAVSLVIEGARCVVVLQEVYEHRQRLLDNEMNPEVAYPAVLDAWDSVGSPQDALDYQP